MKIAIEILGSLKEPSTRNIDTIKQTYVSLANSLQKEGKLKHEYTFFFYYGDDSVTIVDEFLTKDNIFHRFKVTKDETYENCYIIETGVKDTIYSTFEKGIIALTLTDGYDFYIRCNISNYINIPLLDKLLISADKDIVYCNAINNYISDPNYLNDLYPRGDFMLFSNKIRTGILSVCKKYIRCDFADSNRIEIPHVDDCMFGLCLIDYFGKKYYKHLQALNYNFLPGPEISYPDNSIYSTISNRVKTLLPNVNYSGYSWEDNDYRKYDVSKMEYLNNLISKHDYKKMNIGLYNLFSDKRPIPVVQYINSTVKNIFDYLEKKRS